MTPRRARLFNLNQHFSNQEEELAICKTDKGDKAWYLVEAHKIYPDVIEVIYYTTPCEHLDGYETATQCRFRKTWFIRSGTNAGKGTLNAPFPKNPHLRLWTGKFSTNEFNDLILATGIRLDANGYLTKESLRIASQVAIPHEAINTTEDEKEIQTQLQISNAMYTSAEHFECTCRRCRKLWKKRAREGKPHPPRKQPENQPARMNTHRGT
jgi:hypothetical protein